MVHTMNLLDPPSRPCFDPFALASPTSRSSYDPAGHGAPPDDVAEFEAAMADYRGRSGRPSPTWGEVLEVLHGLGYAKRDHRPPPPPGAPPARHCVRFRMDHPAAGAIAEILSRHGGVCLDPRGTWAEESHFEFRSQDAQDAALIAARSAYGWTSVEPRY